MVVMHAHFVTEMEVETMTTTAPEQEPGSDRQRRTRNESESPDDGGRTLILWALASLVAEVVLLSWFFAHVYGA
jgi:hypothetical protein